MRFRTRARHPFAAYLPLMVMLLLAGSLSASRLPAQGRIAGVAMDSLRGGVPLAGATIVLIGSTVPSGDGGSRNRYASADSLGRFVFDSVPAGAQWLAVMHPLLDALDLSLPPVPVTVAARGETVATLAIPAVRGLHRMICGSEAPPGAGLVIGTVARPSSIPPDTPMQVKAAWSEMLVEQGRLSRVPREVAISPNAQGTFVLCGVPSMPRVRFSASAGSDTIGTQTVVLGAAGVARVALPAAQAVGTGPDGRPVQQLMGMEVRADATPSAPAAMGSFEGFEARRRMGLGAFRVVDDHSRNASQTLTDILATMRGVTTEGRGRARAPLLRGFSGGKCWPNYFVDGMYFKVESNAPPDPNPFTELEMFVPPSAISAVEVYSSPIGIPPVYDLSGHTGCGTILIWTNRRMGANPPG